MLKVFLRVYPPLKLFSSGSASPPRGRWGEQIALLLLLAVSFTHRLWTQNDPSIREQIEAYMQNAQRAMQSKDFAGAEQDFQAILTLDPNNIDARGNVGVMRYFQGDWAGAAKQFREVLRSQPKVWKIDALLGMCEDRMGDPRDGKRALEEALPHLSKGPLQAQVGLELAQILYASGDLDRVVDVVRILLPSNPKNPDVLYAAARVYADLANRSRDALALAAPNSARTYQLMAEFEINMGYRHAAIVDFRKALKLAPTLSGIHDELGDALILSREPADLEAGEKQFRTAVKENPGDANAEFRLGTIYSLRKDYKSAIQYYVRALQLQRDNAYAQQELGWAWFELGKPQVALEHLLAATRLDPLFSTTYYQLGTVYRQLGQDADAHRALAIFEKLEAAQKQLDQVYLRARPIVGKPGHTGP
jgi:tetratricopeptide (TPR) repeat protein